MSEAVWIAILTIAAGSIAALLKLLFDNLCEQIKVLAADIKHRHEEVMGVLGGYVEREPHHAQHQAIDNRLNDHASRLRALEEARVQEGWK